MGRIFCPVCGSSVEKLYGGMCEECYRKTHPLVILPKKAVKIIICPVCGSYLIGRKWYNPKIQGDISEVVQKTLSKSLKMKGEVKDLEVANANFDEILGIKRGMVRIRIRGKALPDFPFYDEEYNVSIKLEFKLCPKCIDIKSKREMARVQVRVRNRTFTREEVSKIERTVNKILQELYSSDKSAVPIEVTIKDEGIDYIFSSQKVARTVALRLKKIFKAEILETFKNAGISDKGKRLSKITYRVQLPEFREGDLIVLNNKRYYVYKIANRQLKLLSFPNYSFKNIFLTKSLANLIHVVMRRETMGYALVVSVTPPYVQIMMLDGEYSTKEIWLPKIPKWIEQGKKIGYFTLDDGIFLVPLPT